MKIYCPTNLKMILFFFLLVVITLVQAKDSNADDLLKELQGGNIQNAVRIINNCQINKIDENGTPVLILAIRRDYTNIVKLLVAKGADVNLKSNQDITALYVASAGGKTEILKILLEAKADMTSVSNTLGRGMETALDIAKRKGHNDIVMLLKKYGAKK